jgi:hypothetical protein
MKHMESFQSILRKILKEDHLHAKWLNTLSFMENTGARKISASEHPLKVTELILKHAAEEARHAYFLKKQIAKLNGQDCPDYSFNYLLAPMMSYQYLHRLDVFTSGYVKKHFALRDDKLAYACYLLVTYAIEVRADHLYPLYQEELDRDGSKVNVKSIIAEETGHLEEMIRQLENFSPAWKDHAFNICQKEKLLFENWLNALEAEILKKHTSAVKFTVSQDQ